MKVLRKSQDRGFFDFEWLKTHHTFSFGHYRDMNWVQFGNLRVINEDYIDGQKGFDFHPHRDMEIVTYMIEGTLHHRDSLGNSYDIRPGEIQIMSAGTGIVHSEMNETNQNVHLLQIWILPDTSGINPSYRQQKLIEPHEMNLLKLIASDEDQSGSMRLNAKAQIWAGKFQGQHVISQELHVAKKYWLQLIAGKIEVDQYSLGAGDGLGITEEKTLNLAMTDAHFLLFELLA